MLKTLRKKLFCLLIALVFGLLLPVFNEISLSAKGTPPLKGTFIQLYRHHQDWPAEKWSKIFNYLKLMQIEEVIVQWTVYDDVAFYSSQENRDIPLQALDQISTLASANGIKVWLGLVYDSQFWSKIQRDPFLVEVYLRRLRLKSEEVASVLARNYPNLEGWYIATEIDDQHWQESDNRRVLFDYLKNLTAYLHQLVPSAPVAISGFSNAFLDPSTLENFWASLLKGSEIDVIFFQDGIGTQKLRLSYLPLYLEAIQNAAKRQGRRLKIVVELFRQVQADPFQAVPASWESFQQQLAVAEQYAPANLLAFSIPEYMSPLGGEAAAHLYHQYLKTYILPEIISQENNHK